MKRVLAGDSLAVGLAAPLRRIWPQIICVAQDGRQAWEEQHIPTNASLVMISLGTNDADARAPEDWEHEYAERLNAIMREAGTARFVWLLPPPMGDPSLEFLVEQRRAVIQKAASRAGALLFPPWPGPDYQESMDGWQIRECDGVHCTAIGYSLWAVAIAKAVDG
ncbi:MAG: hypothetical protein K6F46_09165 [Desulfovibrio sp.]|nr:hypothetical protein [Desulfovibrio sp.]